jgi:hypothetical protein
MAESPAHRFGQVIGDLLEEILHPVLQRFCDERGLFLDRHGTRTGVRSGKKVSWSDKYGNSHDLDFVIEKGGSATSQGKPVAFIEAAWRRYPRHSRAKAQEIQGAVLPIAEKYVLDSPFLGAVLAGIFTSGSLNQLESLGFNIVYMPYEAIVDAFRAIGIDARFDETTPDNSFRHCVDTIAAMSIDDRTALKAHITQSSRLHFELFFDRLRTKLDRLVERVSILPLFGELVAFDDVGTASEFIEMFDPTDASGGFRRYDVSIQFTNGDDVRGAFAEKREALRFLTYMTS